MCLNGIDGGAWNVGRSGHCSMSVDLVLGIPCNADGQNNDLADLFLGLSARSELFPNPWKHWKFEASVGTHERTDGSAVRKLHLKSGLDEMIEIFSHSRTRRRQLHRVWRHGTDDASQTDVDRRVFADLVSMLARSSHHAIGFERHDEVLFGPYESSDCSRGLGGSNS